MALVPAKCTECGASIEIDNTKEAGICTHCGTAFITQKAINNYVTNNIVTNNFTKIINGKEQDSGEEEFAKGLTNLKLKKYDRALENFDKAIKESPDTAKYYLYAALAVTEDFVEVRYLFEEPYFDEDMKRAPWYPISDFFEIVKENQISDLEKDLGFNLSEGVEGFVVDVLKQNFNKIVNNPKNVEVATKVLFNEKYKDALFYILDKLHECFDKLNYNPANGIIEFLLSCGESEEKLEKYQIFKFKIKELKNKKLSVDISGYMLTNEQFGWYTEYQRNEKVKINNSRVEILTGACKHLVLTPNILGLGSNTEKQEQRYGIIELDETCTDDRKEILCGTRKSVNIYSSDSYWNVGSAYGIVILPENMKEVDYTFYREYEDQYVLIYAKGKNTKIKAINSGKNSTHKCVVVQDGKIKHKPIFASSRFKRHLEEQLKLLKEIYPEAY